MRLPKATPCEGQVKRELVRFGGVNYGEGASDGELAESMGLSAGKFPCLSQRGGRAVVGTYTKPNGVFAWGKLCVVDGTSLLYDGVQVGTVTDTPKEWAVVNTKLCIFPDKKCLDLTTREFTDLQSQRKSVGGTTVSFDSGAITIRTEAAYGVGDGQYLFFVYNDGEGVQIGRHTVKRYTAVAWNDETKVWTLTGETEVEVGQLNSGDVVMLKKTDVSGNYVLNTREVIETHGTVTKEAYAENHAGGYYGIVTGRVTTSELGDPGFAGWAVADLTKITFDAVRMVDADPPLSSFFTKGDKVTITGAANEKNNVKLAEIQSITDERNMGRLTFKTGTFEPGTQTVPVTITRTVPDLRFICESGNRLWGCEGHTLYASALGDPTHFYDFAGTTMDSYTVAVGTDGAFTGCAAYSGNVLFFKEQCLHKVLGSYPAEYALYCYNIEGVQAGSHKAIEIINEVLYYKGRTGVFAYTGGTPALVSQCLGARRYEDAVGGSDGARYYISMRDGAQWALLVYDTKSRMWLREDNTRAVDFANLGGVLCCMDASNGKVWQADRGSLEQVPWMAEFAPFTEDILERKRPLRLCLRLELAAGASVQIETRQDAAAWKRVWGTGDGRARTVTVPLLPQRCDRFCVRLSGQGGCILRALVREYQVGSVV